jgi:predicted transcriptional regulator
MVNAANQIDRYWSGLTGDRQIPSSVINPKADDGIRRTRIMYNSFLSYSMVTHYLKLLTEKGSLEYDELNKTYRITEAGLRVLELHNKIIEMLKV